MAKSMQEKGKNNRETAGRLPESQRCLGVQRIEPTDEKYTDESGLILAMQYFRQVGIIDFIVNELMPCIKLGKVKGADEKERVEQIIFHIISGKYPSIRGFDIRKEDEGVRVGLGFREWMSSYSANRFFHKFGSEEEYRAYEAKVNKILEEVAVHIIDEEVREGKVVVVGVDSKSWRQGYAQEREGAEWTYAGETGYHPVVITVNGQVWKQRFWRGSRHCNKGDEVREDVKEVIGRIREEWGEDVEIYVRMDAGYMDGKIYKVLDEAGVKFAGGGKMPENVRRLVAEIEDWEVYWDESAKEGDEKRAKRGRKGKKEKNNVAYHVGLTQHGCESWGGKEYRMVVMRLIRKGNTAMLPGILKERVFYTNMEPDALTSAFRRRYAWEDESGLMAITRFYHGRGEDELVFRRIVGIWRESLPFQSFMANGMFFGFIMLAIHCMNIFERRVLYPFHKDTFYNRPDAPPASSEKTKPKRRRPILSIPWKYIQTIRQLFLHVPGKVKWNEDLQAYVLYIPYYICSMLRLDKMMDFVLEQDLLFQV